MRGTRESTKNGWNFKNVCFILSKFYQSVLYPHKAYHQSKLNLYSLLLPVQSSKTKARWIQEQLVEGQIKVLFVNYTVLCTRLSLGFIWLHCQEWSEGFIELVLLICEIPVRKGQECTADFWLLKTWKLAKEFSTAMKIIPWHFYWVE